MRHSLLGSIAVVSLLALGAAGTAQAVPSYGYATIGFTAFKLDTGTAAVDTSSVLMNDASNYLGVGNSGSASGDVTTGVNVLQSFSGPGPAPGQNVFTPALTVTSGARGDGLITGALAVGAVSNLVSEGHLTTGPGTAGSSAGSSTVLQVIATALANTTAILTFHATAHIDVSVGQIGDSASALVAASYSITDITGGGSVAVLINDDFNNAAPDVATVAPTGLNQSRQTINPAGPLTFDSPDTAYSFSASLLAGHTYQFVLGDSTQEILATVPEPFSIALLGSGLTLLGLVRRRRS